MQLYVVLVLSLACVASVAGPSGTFTSSRYPTTYRNYTSTKTVVGKGYQIRKRLRTLWYRLRDVVKSQTARAIAWIVLI